MESKTHDQVREYYGITLGSTRDLKTSACCPTGGMPTNLAAIAAQLEDEIVSRFYGCGSPIPEALEGRTVLDLGCGTGRDVFICAKLVGPEGRVIGVDMTPEQIEVGRRLTPQQTAKLGLPEPNVRFLEGPIEDLAALGVADESVDVVISNCVMNLAPDKRAVFREVMRVLKPGGELYFADVFADRRVPEALLDDPVLRGECLSGAMYTEDFRRLMTELGVPDVRVVSDRAFAIDDAEVATRIGMVGFTSRTVRAFKIAGLEDRCEDYGQVARYLGTISGHPHELRFDDHHVFPTGKPVLVCGNTASMLSETRFAGHFEVAGDRSTHFGLFGEYDTRQEVDSATSGACC